MQIKICIWQRKQEEIKLYINKLLFLFKVSTIKIKGDKIKGTVFDMVPLIFKII